MDEVQTADTQAQVREYAPMEVRRSFRLLSMDVIFYLCGLAFIDSSTVLPAFLAMLTKSSIVIGSLTAIRTAGTFIPQLWTAHYLRHRKHHKAFLMKDAAVSRVAIAVFGIALFLVGPRDKAFMLAAFIVMYSAFWISEGIAGVPWTDLVAKTIPERQRGRLFGFTQFGGGILALLAGLLISRILSPKGPAYPMNYAILMCVGAFFFWCSFFSLLAVREPEGEPEEHDGGFWQYVRNIGGMLAGHDQLKRVLIVQLLIGFNGMSLPFYILYAKQNMAGAPTGMTIGEMAGILLSVQVAGSIILSAVAGYVSDHLGPKWAILTSVMSGFVAPVVALLIRGFSMWWYGVVFFALGGLTGSAWIGLTNCVLENADPRERRSAIGLMNTASAPTIIFPILGGLIAQEASYRTAFAITAAALGVALVTAFSLQAKRSESI